MFSLKLSKENCEEILTFLLNSNESKEYLVHFSSESKNDVSIKKVEDLVVDERKASPIWFSHNSSWGNLPSGSSEWSFFSNNQETSTIWHNNVVLEQCDFVDLNDGDEIKILYQNCKQPTRILYTKHIPITTFSSDEPNVPAKEQLVKPTKSSKASESSKTSSTSTASVSSKANESSKTSSTSTASVSSKANSFFMKSVSPRASKSSTPKKSKKTDKSKESDTDDKLIDSLLIKLSKACEKKSALFQKVTVELEEKEKKIRKLEEENPARNDARFAEEKKLLREKINRMEDEYENILCKLVEVEGKYKADKEQLNNELQNTKTELMKLKTESSVESTSQQRKDQLQNEKLNMELTTKNVELTTKNAELERLSMELQNSKKQYTLLEEKLYQEKSSAVVTWQKLNDYRTKRSYTEMEQELTCPICQGVLHDTVSLNCGHSFCHECIKTWRLTKNQCPTCRKKPKYQFPVLALNKVVEKIMIQTPEDTVEKQP